MRYRNELIWLRAASIVAATLTAAACAVLPDRSSVTLRQDESDRFAAAVQQAVACRADAARDPRFVDLNLRMPLGDISNASLPQMADSARANAQEIATLDVWTHTIDACRDQLLAVSYTTSLGFGPILEDARDNDDAVYVMLARRKIGWGDAVMRLKANRTALRAALIARADQIDARASDAQEAERNRRTTVWSAIIRIVP